uniref:cellulase n=1 Tax=Antipaluria urichi TaxID=270842 RepID=A0A288QQW3_9NEOP|nr:cellulase [Antipaluria urichi]
MHLSFYCVLLLVSYPVFSAAASYDYKQVLNYSLLFYEAQRSGKLPADQHVTWRKDAALDDKGNNGEDLTGGYFDAGDFVKFGLPLAYTVTTLSWGVILYEDAYVSTNLLDEVHEAIKWGTDYILKCHVDDYVFYGQVGNGELDHTYWGRPEDMTMERPAYQINASAPGSDLAGETAAALAAASIVFKTVDPDYSATLLEHARTMFDFAVTYRGKYSDSITDANGFYRTITYEDELVWGAMWLYKATEEADYLSQAEDLYQELRPEAQRTGFDWEQKISGAEILLAEYSSNATFKTNTQNYVDYLVNNQTRTPKGLAFIATWGPLRYTANAVFIALRAADLGIGNPESYRSFAQSQVGYMLGDTGRSFVIGFGENYPTHEHHRSSSCPDAPATCDWMQYGMNDSNYHILYGALVGGPDQDDQYTDIRYDAVHNEVACDYNAAFQGVIAAFVHLGY